MARCKFCGHVIDWTTSLEGVSANDKMKENAEEKM